MIKQKRTSEKFISIRHPIGNYMLLTHLCLKLARPNSLPRLWV